MNRIRAVTAWFSVWLLLAPMLGAQGPQVTQAGGPKPAAESNESPRFLERLTSPYRMQDVRPVNLANSSRLDQLLRGGKLYLSLQDTIALALENNLDIELQRYGAITADYNLLRAKAGGLLRGVQTNVAQGPGSAGFVSNAGGQAGQATGVTQSASAAASGASTQGTVITQTGTVIPNLDPVITGLLRWSHNTNPQTASLITGTTSLVNRGQISNFGFQQGFLTGTNVNFSFANQKVTNNSIRSEINPSTTGSFTLQITQNLLQGFGRSVNGRNITISKNNREIADLTFRLQVITTVSAIVNLYYDLVSFNEDVKVRKQAVALNEKLYSDNKKQVEIGTLAPIEIVRAESELARAQQDLILAETRVLQQETILKNALSKTGIASPAVADARIITTDVISMPNVEAVEPMQDMVANAMKARPEISQRRIQLENAKINLRGSRSQLLPSLTGFATFANNALAGDINTVPLPPGQAFIPRNPDAFFVGGYGTVLSQLFRRNFPDYAGGVSLNIPLRNRQARADMALDQVQVRQVEIGLVQLENQVRVDVQNALIGLQQARAQYQAATKARILQEQTLDAEQKKYALGASTIFNVILVQRDLALAQSTEVSALSTYSRARVELDRATGQTLTRNAIQIEEAARGQVASRPAALPAMDKQ